MSQERLARLGASGGILFIVLQLVGQGLIQVGGSEPSFSASSREIVDFFEARNSVLFNIGGYLSTLSLLALLGFLGSLWGVLRRAEGETGWLTIVAIGAGLGIVALLAGGGAWYLAVFRIDEGLDPQIARLLFDLGNFTFATSWVLFGALTLTVATAALWLGAFPKWLGWTGLLVGIGLVTAPTYWTSQVAFTPYALFWLWLIALSVLVFRRAGAQAADDVRLPDRSSSLVTDQR